MSKVLKIQLGLFGIAVALIGPRSAEGHISRIVIDPGHGGVDHGTVYKSPYRVIMEKDVTLRLANQVARQLRARGFLVTLTRKGDQEVPLAARTELANRLGADLFISIHMNSIQGTSRSDAEGVETFTLNNATDASSRRLARLENSVISTQTPLSALDMDIALILKDLRLDGNLAESKRLACHVQENLVIATSSKLNQIRRIRNRGVKQALFHVLLGADMPSILVEAGFLTNAHDRTLVLSPRGQLRMSRAIANAVDQFRNPRKLKRDSFVFNRCKIN